MNKKMIYLLFSVICLIIILLVVFLSCGNNIKTISGNIVEVKSDYFVIKVDESKKYKFNKLDKNDLCKNCSIEVKYKGILKDNSINKMVDYNIFNDVLSLIDQMDKDGIFSAYYSMARDKLNTMSLDEKIAQVLLVRVPEEDAVEIAKKYQFGGYVLYERDFKDKSKEEIFNEVNKYQKVSKIPMLIATDEEGGKVIRASSNKELIDMPFLSSQELYNKGGFDLIEDDTIKKSKFLESLGVNVNLAPVVDVVSSATAYMFERSFGKNTNLTSKYSKTVIDASKKENVSYVLKHFPGYGNSADTHLGGVIDKRSFDDIMEFDIPPFQAGIDAGAEAILVSHLIVESIEKDNLVSLSKNAHELLRETLNFEGAIISDDLDMLATKDADISNVYVKAIEAGNDLIIVSNYEEAFLQIKEAINNNALNEEILDRAVLRDIAWKYYKFLFPIK